MPEKKSVNPKIKSRLLAYYQERAQADGEYSYADLAGELGYTKNSSLISQYFAEKYLGDVTKLEKEAERLLTRVEEKAIINDGKQKGEAFNTFVKTSVWRKFYEAAWICHRKGQIGRVVGDSGIGKTTCANEYKRLEPNMTIVIRAHHRYSTKEVFMDIAKQVGVEPRGTVHRMLTEIVEKVKDTDRFLIIDEAEHLHPNTLDEIRQLNDRCGMGILYVGLTKFKSRLETMRGDYEYILNRIKVPSTIKRLSKIDVDALVRSVVPDISDRSVELLREYAGGSARYLENLFFKSLMVAKKRKVLATDDGFEAVITDCDNALREIGQEGNNDE
jgi:DNA transposition AAA+ family ATPase